MFFNFSNNFLLLWALIPSTREEIISLSLSNFFPRKRLRRILWKSSWERVRTTAIIIIPTFREPHFIRIIIIRHQLSSRPSIILRYNHPHSKLLLSWWDNEDQEREKKSFSDENTKRAEKEKTFFLKKRKNCKKI